MKNLKIYCCNLDNSEYGNLFFAPLFGWYWIGMIVMILFLFVPIIDFNTWSFVSDEITTCTILWRATAVVMTAKLAGMCLAIPFIVLELIIRREWDYLIGFIRDLFNN